MARILVSTVPVAGHIAPFIPVVQALRERGHEVWWYTGKKFQKKVEQAGALPCCFSAAKDYDDSDFEVAFPGRGALSGLTQLKFDMKHVFLEPIVGQLADLEQLKHELRPDFLLADPGMLGAGLLREKGGPDFGVLGVLPLPMSSIDAAPFGLGLPPSNTFLGRLRNRLLNAFVQHVLFRETQQVWNRVRSKLSLQATKSFWMDAAGEHAAFYLQPTIPAFEYPRSDLGKNVHFVGAIEVAPPQTPEAPEFLSELSAGRPVIHVTQGTLANAEPVLFKPAIEALADQDALVVIATGGRSPESLKLGALPSNVRVARFLDYRTFLPKCSLVISNGGYGGVQLTLRQGVPLIVAGASEDKPEVAARVAWAGAGINLKTATPSAEQIRSAVAQIQADPRFRNNAQRLASEYAQYSGVARVVELIEARLGQKRDAA